jgi:hypothetical protein
MRTASPARRVLLYGQSFLARCCRIPIIDVLRHYPHELVLRLLAATFRRLVFGSPTVLSLDRGTSPLRYS